MSEETKTDIVPANPRTEREEILRNRAIEIVGNPDADKALVEIYEGFEDEEKRRRATKMFVVENKSTAAIADKLGVPQRTVAAWAYVGKWNQAAAMEIAILQEEEAIGLARLRLQKRREIVERQLASAQLVRERVEDHIDDMSVKTAAEALKSVADIEARALGMSESGRTETEERKTEERKAKESESKRPLVVIYQQNAAGIPTLGRKPQNVEVVEVKQ